MSEPAPEAVPDSILHGTKDALGLAFDYGPFDSELILHINSVLADLNQLGVGPLEGFSITGPEETWADFIGDEPRLNNIKSYIFLAVGMLHDPPQTGYVLDARTKMLEKAEWRINIAREEIDHPPVAVVVDEDDIFGDP